jgi:hypothetical protein
MACLAPANLLVATCSCPAAFSLVLLVLARCSAALATAISSLGSFLLAQAVSPTVQAAQSAMAATLEVGRSEGILIMAFPGFCG